MLIGRQMPKINHKTEQRLAVHLSYLLCDLKPGKELRTQMVVTEDVCDSWEVRQLTPGSPAELGASGERND